jgi:hypothetical protein
VEFHSFKERYEYIHIKKEVSLPHPVYILYKHTTQNYTYVFHKTQLATSLPFQKLTTCFGPYGPSSGDIF